jgi:cell division protein YceG involved in septum cleavage
MEQTNSILILFSLSVLFIILGIATFVQFQKMKKQKFKGEEKSEGTTSIVIALGETITEK